MDLGLDVDMHWHSFLLELAERTTSVHTCLRRHLITITASQSKFLGFFIFSLVLQGIQQPISLLNEEKGLLDFQGIYVAVSQPRASFVPFPIVSIPGWLHIQCIGLRKLMGSME